MGLKAYKIPTMREIDNLLERVDYESLTTTEKTALSELYSLTADDLTETYEYSAKVGSEINNNIINPDSGGFGDYVGNRDGLNSSVSSYNHVEYQEVDSKHDYDKVLPISLEHRSKRQVLDEIKRQLSMLGLIESETKSDTQEDMSNDSQEDTTQEETTTQDSSVQVIDAETLHEEVKQFGDVAEANLQELHEEIGDFKVTSDTFETELTAEDVMNAENPVELLESETDNPDDWMEENMTMMQALKL